MWYFFNSYANVGAVVAGSAATVVAAIFTADVIVIGNVAVIVSDAVLGSIPFVGDIVGSCFVVYVCEKFTLEFIEDGVKGLSTHVMLYTLDIGLVSYMYGIHKIQYIYVWHA